MITIPLPSLQGRTGAGRLNDGAQLSPSLSRYLGCDAEIIPCFVGTTGELIDLGQARRTFTGPARLALEFRDRGCAWPGCDRPLSWCEAHHIVGWIKGGRTDQSNLARYATSETMTSPLAASGQMSAGSSVNAAAPQSGASVLKCRSSNVRIRVV